MSNLQTASVKGLFLVMVAGMLWGSIYLYRADQRRVDALQFRLDALLKEADDETPHPGREHARALIRQLILDWESGGDRVQRFAAADLKDHWERELRCEILYVPEHGFRVSMSSAGPDGRFYTSDDVNDGRLATVEDYLLAYQRNVGKSLAHGIEPGTPRARDILPRLCLNGKQGSPTVAVQAGVNPHGPDR